eukprot:scaffold95763_cov60-Phaeocystis_antarctica.AAC.3
MSLTVSLLAMAVAGERSCVYVWRHAPAGPLVTAACAAANDGRSHLRRTCICSVARGPARLHVACARHSPARDR